MQRIGFFRHYCGRAGGEMKDILQKRALLEEKPSAGRKREENAHGMHNKREQIFLVFNGFFD